VFIHAQCHQWQARNVALVAKIRPVGIVKRSRRRDNENLVAGISRRLDRGYRILGNAPIERIDIRD